MGVDDMPAQSPETQEKPTAESAPFGITLIDPTDAGLNLEGSTPARLQGEFARQVAAQCPEGADQQ